MLKWTSMTLCAFFLINSTLSAHAANDEYNTNQREEYTPTATQEQKNNNKWIEVQDTNGLFKALFPSKPNMTANSLPIPNTDLTIKQENYLAENSEGAGALISLIFFPPDQQIIKSLDKEKLLKQMVKEVVEKADERAEMTSLTKTQFKNYSAFNFSFTIPQQRFKGMIFMVQNTVFLVLLSNQKEDFSEQEYEYFINHFQLSSKVENGLSV